MSFHFGNFDKGKFNDFKRKNSANFKKSEYNPALYTQKSDSVSFKGGAHLQKKAAGVKKVADKVLNKISEMLVQNVQSPGVQAFAPTVCALGLYKEFQNNSADEIMYRADAAIPRRLEQNIDEQKNGQKTPKFAAELSVEELSQKYRLSPARIEILQKRGVVINDRRQSRIADLTDEEWEVFKARNLSVYDKHLYVLIDMPESLWQNLKKRNLDKNDYDQILLATLPDQKWHKFNERGLSASDEHLLELLDLFDEEWKIVEEREIDTSMDTFDRLLYLTDKEWANLEKRKLDKSFGNAIDLAELSDEEWERFKARNLNSSSKYWRDLLYLSESDWQKFRQRGLEDCLNSYQWKDLLNLDENTWNNIKKRKLDLSENLILNLANMTDEQWENLEKRGLSKNDDSQIQAALLSDEEWQKFCERKLDTSTLGWDGLLRLNDDEWKIFASRNLKYLSQKDLIYLPDKEWFLFEQRNLDKDTVNIPLLKLSDKEWATYKKRKLNVWGDWEYLLSLSDENWKILEERSNMPSYFSCGDLGNLSDEQWKNFEKRNIRTVNSSTVQLAKLSDAEWQKFKERNLVPEDEEWETVLPLSDEEFKKYTERKLSRYIRMIEPEFARVLAPELLKFNDKQFENFEKILVPRFRQMCIDNEMTDFFVYYTGIAALEDKNEFAAAMDFVTPEVGLYDDQIISVVKKGPEFVSKMKKIINFQTDNLTMPNPNNSRFMVNLVDCDDKVLAQIKKMSRFFPKSFVENAIKEKKVFQIANSEIFKENIPIIRKIGRLDSVIRDRLYYLVFDLKNPSEPDKISEINKIKQLKNGNIFTPEELKIINFDKLIEKLESGDDEINISVGKVSRKNYLKMINTVFKNNHPYCENFIETENVLKNTNFEKFGKNGLPLEYSRQDFLKDLSDILNNLDPNQREEILKKLDIKVSYDFAGNISGYDKFLNLSLLSENGTEGEIKALVDKFVNHNKIQTGEKELDEILNALLGGFPEFINVIGKQQHETHDMSVDVHTLTVLKEALSHPDFETLSAFDKFCLKVAILLHDISKTEFDVDKTHPETSAKYASFILDRKISYTDKNGETRFLRTFHPNVKNRIIELIKYHSWFENFNTNYSVHPSSVIFDTATKFRRKDLFLDDLKLARIMTAADLKGVKFNGTFYDNLYSNLNSDVQSKIDEKLSEINGDGQILLPSEIKCRPSKIPTVTKDGYSYKVIDFTTLDENNSVAKFPSSERSERISLETLFGTGMTKDNFRIFVHTVANGSVKNLETAYELSDINKDALVCASCISPELKKTYNDNKFGLSLIAPIYDIANASEENQSSGRKKTFSLFQNFVDENSVDIKFRKFLPEIVKKELDLTNEEYSELFSKLGHIRNKSSLFSKKRIAVGEKTFTGNDILRAVLKSENELMKGMLNPSESRQNFAHNEINLYSPTTNALVAKVDNFEDIPDDILTFVRERNLPIYILGK